MTTNSTGSGRRPGRRLSPLRVLIGIAVALTIVGGAVAVPWYLAERAPAFATEAGPRWFGGYFDATAAPVSARATVGDGTDDSVVLAFVVASDASTCEPSWGAAYNLRDAASELDLDRRIDNMRRDGAHVAVSFGGALNTELGVACESTEALTDAYAAVIERYGVSTIDLDLENQNLSDTAAGARRAAAIAVLQNRAPAGSDLSVWLTLPTATDGLTDQGIAAVQQMLEAGVSLAGVNAMTMDYGTDLEGQTMAEASISALEAVNEQLTKLYSDLRIALPSGGAWAIMGATPMIGQNDVVDEVFTISDAQDLNEFAREKELARMSMWSINRDRTCGPNYPNLSVVSDACSGVEQNSATFAGVLSSGFDESATDVRTPSPRPTPAADDPETSPYPIWSPAAAYSADVRVVRHGYVYAAKWWVTGAPAPDDPTQAADQTAWTLLGAVMPDDAPYTLPTVAAGTYPSWVPAQMYEAGDRVVVDGVPYEAEWWTQGEDPRIGITDRDRSPWTLVAEASAG